ncbi:DUF3179 domain-containing protein [Piscinibacter sakaiensis]|uniref:DUF3179 domain-containing protein n=1 Tax=Piscinibacter sakaiensis TaxID=1547922 RepID=UPI003AB0DC94
MNLFHLIAVRRRSLAALLVLLSGVSPSLLAGSGNPPRVSLNGFDISDPLVPIAAIQRGGPPKDGIPAIDKPVFIAAGEAALAPDDRVLGLAIDGQARAYPIRILNWHEVVNDRFGDRRIVVSYCPLCGTGVVFEPAAGHAESGFGVSGLLYNSDVLLYDRATSSLWSQIMQQAISGPAKGTRLKMLPVTHTSWADWRSRQPSTTVLSTDTGFFRNYRLDPYAGYEQRSALMFDVQNRDDRIGAKEWVLGVEIGGRHKAYPFSVLEKRVDAKGEFADRLGGQALRIRFDARHRSAEALDAQGQVLPTITAYWFAWVAFHPKTELLLPR